jgi:presenilin-like A22 family membrane protease
MKHTAVVTFFLVLIFVLTQVVGLALIKSISTQTYVDESGQTRIAPDASTVDMTPKTTGAASLLYIIIAIGIGTALILLIVKFNKVNIWKAWFFLAVAMAIGISFKVILKDVIPAAGFVSLLPWLIGGLFALLKIFWRNPIVYNISEVLMYAGIGLILAPIFNVLWAIILLVLISAYDMYAVWKSRHMVKMAQFQQKSTVFAGLMIPYKLKKSKEEKSAAPMKAAAKGAAAKTSAKTAASATASNATEDKTAILGGGDVAFPLIFEGVILRDLIMKGVAPNAAFLTIGIIVATTTIALAWLFIAAKKDKFYPAMPFISAGCLAGWGITLLL